MKVLRMIYYLLMGVLFSTLCFASGQQEQVEDLSAYRYHGYIKPVAPVVVADAEEMITIEYLLPARWVFFRKIMTNGKLSYFLRDASCIANFTLVISEEDFKEIDTMGEQGRQDTDFVFKNCLVDYFDDEDGQTDQAVALRTQLYQN